MRQQTLDWFTNKANIEWYKEELPGIKYSVRYVTVMVNNTLVLGKFQNFDNEECFVSDAGFSYEMEFVKEFAEI